MSNKWKIFWIGALAFVVIFQACGMHSWQEMVISTADERKMGEEYDSLIRIGDPSVLEAGESVFVPQGEAQQKLYDYYQARGREIIDAVSSSDLDAVLPSGYTKNNFFNFKIINSKQINAFAVPGGFMYFYTAILKSIQSESEMMSIMGHEIGHVILHHSRDKMVKAGVMGMVIDALLGDGLGGTVASLGTSVWLLGGSRENELEADSMGYIFTHKIGVSPKGLGEFFGRGLEKNADGTCKDPAANSSILDVFSTHPPSCERIAKNTARMTEADKMLPMSKSGTDLPALVKAAGI